VIILFAKAPVPGRVKTRLLERFSPEETAELHTAFVEDTLAMLAELSGRADLQLSTDVPTEAWARFHIARRVQVQGDLGARILHALAEELALGRPQAMVLGSDSPTLPAAHLDKLLTSPADVALGPAADGGYYAIACRKIHAEMFAGVEWSGPRAVPRPCLPARRHGWKSADEMSWGPAIATKMKVCGSCCSAARVEWEKPASPRPPACGSPNWGNERW